MSRSFLRIIALNLVALSLLLSAHAQKTNGAITGTVADAMGAMVPEAAVKMVAQDTNFSRSTTTNAEGSFTFPEVPPGVYNVTVTRQGFKEITQTGLQVHVADTKTMRFKLEVGAGSDVITVESSPVLVETQTGAVSNIILGAQVRELPLNGRSFVQLTTLMPGASPAENVDFTNRGLFAGVDISYNGAAVTNNQWLVDGANNNDVGSQRTILIFPSIDAIEEFKILRGSYGPEHGNASGAQVNVITRGGGNKFHGSGYYFGRNDKLAAKNYFLGRGVTDCSPGDPRCSKGKLRWNGWGYTIGGPIKKDKVFFFWSQEWNHEIRGQTRTGIVPTPLELTGNFSQTCAAGPNARVPGDPANAFAPFPGNVIPPNRLSPAGQAYLLTLPTANITADPCANPNWIDSVPIVQNWRQESARGDIKLTNSTNLMLRWAQDSWINDQHAAIERGLWGSDRYPAVDDAWTQPGKLAVAKLTTTFGSTAVNDFQFSWTGNRINVKRVGDEQLNSNVLSNLPLIFPFSDKLRGDDQPVPICWCGGLSGLIGGIGPWENRQDLFAWRDDFSKVMGNHIFKVGVAYDRNAKDEQVGQENAGFWGIVGFQNNWSGSTGNNYADFLLREMSWGQNENQAEVPIQIRWRTLEFYGGDSWKVHPRFTLEYGVRWSFLYRPYTDDNRLAGFSPDAFDPALGGSPCNGVVMAAGAPNECQTLGFAGGTFFENRSLVRNDNNAIAPRVGFAWDVSGSSKFVLRGGVGQFFARDRLTALDVGAVNPPFQVSVGGERFLDPLPDNDNSGLGDHLFDISVGGAPQRGLDPDARLTNTWQWNLTADMELWKDTRFELAYVGTRGIHIQTTWNANQVIHGDLNNDGIDDRINNALNSGDDTALHPFGASARAAGNIITWGNRGDSIYHALQGMFSTKFGRSSIAQFSYTWSRNIGNASLAYVGADQAIPDYEDTRANRGPVDFHRPHIFSANLIYNLPELNGRSSLMRHAFGGWQLGSILNLATGPAITTIGGVSGSVSPSGTSSGQQFANRPLRVLSEPCRSNSADPVQWLNPNAFTWDGFAVGTNGNSGPGTCYGPPIRAIDLAFDKNWKVPWFGGDNARLQFRFEIFNAFNTPHFRNLNLHYDVQGSSTCNGSAVPVVNGALQGATLCNGSFGRAQDVGRLNREMQYGLKLIF